MLLSTSCYKRQVLTEKIVFLPEKHDFIHHLDFVFISLFFPRYVFSKFGPFVLSAGALHLNDEWMKDTLLNYDRIQRLQVGLLGGSKTFLDRSDGHTAPESCRIKNSYKIGSMKHISSVLCQRSSKQLRTIQTSKTFPVTPRSLTNEELGGRARISQWEKDVSFKSLLIKFATNWADTCSG